MLRVACPFCQRKLSMYSGLMLGELCSFWSLRGGVDGRSCCTSQLEGEVVTVVGVLLLVALLFMP